MKRYEVACLINFVCGTCMIRNCKNSYNIEKRSVEIQNKYKVSNITTSPYIALRHVKKCQNLFSKWPPVS